MFRFVSVFFPFCSVFIYLFIYCVCVFCESEIEIISMKLSRDPCREACINFFLFLWSFHDVDSCMTTISPVGYIQQTKQGYVYRHVAIKIWGQIMNASCQTAAGVVEARNKERKRERERERERENKTKK